MADQIIAASLQLNSQQANESVKTFRGQLRDATNDLNQVVEKFGLTSKEARIAAQRVAELKDTMGDAATLVDAFNPDRKFQAFGIAVKGVTNGFTALQGVMGLVGSESEDLQKTLVKVQSALALSEGVNGLMEMKDGFKIVQNVAVNAFNKIKTAIGSTGIGLLVIAIGSLVAYWDDIGVAISGVSDEQKKLAEDAAKTAHASGERLKTLESSENILKAQGKSEREILNMKIAAVKTNIEDTAEHIKKRKVVLEGQIQAEERNRKMLRGALDFVGGGINLLLKGVDLIGKAFGKNWNLSGKLNDWITNKVFDPEATKAKAKAELEALDQGLLDQQNKLAGFQNSVREIDKKAAQDAENLRKENLDKNLKAYDEELAIKIKKAQDEARWIVEEREKARKEAEDAAARDKRLNSSQDRSTSGINTNSGIQGVPNEDQLALTRELLSSETDLKMFMLDEEYKKKFELIKGNEDAELALKQQYSNRKKAIDDAEVANKMQQLNQISGLLGNAAEIFGKQTVAYKVLATSQALIDTYTGANAAYKSFAGIPVVGHALGIAAATVAVVQGLKRVRDINKVQVPGGGGGGGGSIPSVSAAPPLNPAPQVGTTSLDQSTLNQIGNSTVRAFVVESDVSSNQDKMKRLNRAARLG